MNISRFFIKFALFSLFFSAMQPTLTMNEPTNVTLANRLKSFITSPKAVVVLSFCALVPYGYKTGNWDIALSLLGASFGLYTFLEYRRDMAWRVELERFAPKERDNKKEYNQENIAKAIELLHKINDKKLNLEMSYWTRPVFKNALKTIIKTTETEIDTESIKTIDNLAPIITNSPSKLKQLKTRVGKLYSHIEENTSDEIKKNTYNEIKDSL